MEMKKKESEESQKNLFNLNADLSYDREDSIKKMKNRRRKNKNGRS